MSADTSPPPPAAAGKPRRFPCSNCGANLVWDPGSTSLKCPYCGTENTVAPDPAAAGVVTQVGEQDFFAQLNALSGSAETVDVLAVRCDGCGAEHEMRQGQTAGTCPFCGTGLVAQAQSRRLIKPQSLLPFHVPREHAVGAFNQWIGGLWFAPSNLRSLARHDALQGVYVPAWTYDSNADTAYTGQRGDDYWDTETYTTTENGQSVTRTHQVRRTRWSYASGRVFDSFDDVLVLAVHSLPPKARALEPWDLHALVPYDDRYLSGFVADGYTIDLANGFEVAKGIMQPVIEGTIRRDIGGDHQRIGSADTTYLDVTFKHLLLPMWVSAYRYQGRVFTFLVNARTGEVQGDRPYSAWKIAALVVAILIVIAVIVLIAQSR